MNLNGSTEANLAGFARWGKGYDDANVDMGPQSFYLALSNTDRLESVLDAFDLDDDGVVKVATYQCLCRVRGKMRFALVKSDDASVVFDEVVLDSQSAYSDTTLVTLRGQVAADLGATFFKVRIENLLSSPTRWQVFSQQAWGGTQNTADFPNYPLEVALANQTFVPTADDAPSRNRYQWGVNALSVIAQSRLAIPAKANRYGWDQRNSIATDPVADLRDGDVHYSTQQKAVLMVMNQNQMFCTYQPERVLQTIESVNWQVGNEKNIVFGADDDGSGTLTLPTSVNEVPVGTIVRVYNATGGAYTVGVKFGSGGSLNVIAENNMGEYVFMGGVSDGQWRSLQHNVPYVE